MIHRIKMNRAIPIPPSRIRVSSPKFCTASLMKKYIAPAAAIGNRSTTAA